MLERRVSLKEIAARAGVSAAAVSYALNGTGRLSEAKRQAILKVAKELNYQTDPMLHALCRYRREIGNHTNAQQTLAFLIAQEIEKVPHGTADVRRLQAGVLEAGREMGLNVEVFRHDGTQTAARRLSRVFYTRGIRGVILSFSRPYERESPNELEWDKFAVVACKPLLAHDRFHSVGTDNFSNGRRMHRQLQELGFKRIGLYFDENLDILTGRAFKAGVWAEQQKVTPVDQQIPFLQGPESEQVFFDWFERWQPDAIITQGTKIYGYLGRRGVRVPDDVSVAVPSTSAGFRNSGIDQNYHRMGREAVRLLWDKLIPTQSYGIAEFPLRITIPCSWNPGKTVAAKGLVAENR
jgi:LacI family transcriptional regulator